MIFNSCEIANLIFHDQTSTQMPVFFNIMLISCLHLVGATSGNLFSEFSEFLVVQSDLA